MRVSRPRSQLLTAITMAALYLVIAGSVEPLELVVASLSGVTAGSIVRRVARRSRVHFYIRLGWLREAFGLPLQVVKDCATILIAIPKFLASSRSHIGTFTTLPFSPPVSPASSAEVAGWRAITILFVSMPPNTYFVRDAQEQMVVHRLLEPRSRSVGSGQ